MFKILCEHISSHWSPHAAAVLQQGNNNYDNNNRIIISFYPRSMSNTKNPSAAPMHHTV